MSQSIRHLMQVAAEMRAVGHSWDAVARKVNRKADTCQKWTRRYSDDWRLLYRGAQRRRFEETANEAHTHLVGLLRGDEPRWKAKAIELWMKGGLKLGEMEGAPDDPGKWDEPLPGMQVFHPTPLEQQELDRQQKARDRRAAARVPEATTEPTGHQPPTTNGPLVAAVLLLAAAFIGRSEPVGAPASVAVRPAYNVTHPLPVVRPTIHIEERAADSVLAEPTLGKPIDPLPLLTHNDRSPRPPASESHPMIRTVTILSLCLVAADPTLAQNPREKKVRDDKVKVEADGYWIYNDFPKAVAEAKKANKPIVVCFRCIPCEECVKLDDDLVNTDPTLRPLLDQYVRVRVVSTNGLDLSLFQYDYDQSFAVFLLNADGTIYGRFGTRSHRTNWVGDVSIPGLAKALKGGLDLHADYPKNKATLAGKRGPAPDFPTPEKFPSLGKYSSTIDYKGNVVGSCIHCHQIGDAMKDLYRAKKEPMPETVLFPYPHPKSIGLVLDPKERATVLEVTEGTPAAKAGFKTGDVIRTLDGQPMLSVADVQWVLHRTPPEGGTVKAVVERGGTTADVMITLADGWRRAGDISWRSSSWGLRRMALGGLLLEELPGDGRPNGVAKGNMALRVKHVGQYGPHATAKNAGVQVGDILIGYDGKTDLTRETDVLIYGVTARKPGDKVPLTLMRGGKKIELTLPLPQ